MKLSKMWYRAAKELKQVKEDFGSVDRKEACAMGAICYYLSDGVAINPASLTHFLDITYNHLLFDFRLAYGEHVITLNDKEGWSFEQFAKKAEELGL